MPRRDVVIQAPIAQVSAAATPPGASPEEYLEMENRVLRTQLFEQEVSAETAMRMLACLIRYVQAREGLGQEAVVELPRELVTMMEDLKVCVVEQGGKFQLSLKEIT